MKPAVFSVLNRTLKSVSLLVVSTFTLSEPVDTPVNEPLNSVAVIIPVASIDVAERTPTVEIPFTFKSSALILLVSARPVIVTLPCDASSEILSPATNDVTTPDSAEPSPSNDDAVMIPVKEPPPALFRVIPIPETPSGLPTSIPPLEVTTPITSTFATSS